MTDARFPIGLFEMPANVSPARRETWMQDIAELPALLRAAVAGREDEDLDLRSREWAWTVRQLIHHLADLHAHGASAFRAALAERDPPLLPLPEKVLAHFPDARETDVDVLLLAGRYTLLEQGALDDLLPACEERGLRVVAASIFNSGLLALDRPPAETTWPARGRVVLHAPAAQVSRWVRPDQGTVTPRDAGSCVLEVGSWTWPSLVAWLLLFEADVEVLDPPELLAAVEEITARLGRAAAG